MPNRAQEAADAIDAMAKADRRRLLEVFITINNLSSPTRPTEDRDDD